MIFATSLSRDSFTCAGPALATPRVGIVDKHDVIPERDAADFNLDPCGRGQAGEALAPPQTNCGQGTSRRVIEWLRCPSCLILDRWIGRSGGGQRRGQQGQRGQQGHADAARLLLIHAPTAAARRAAELHPRRGERAFGRCAAASGRTRAPNESIHCEASVSELGGSSGASCKPGVIFASRAAGAACTQRRVQLPR